jgi:hypothetical protein
MALAADKPPRAVLKDAKKQRVRLTNRGREAQRFSSVRKPRGGDVVHGNAEIHSMTRGEADRFDPIPGDGMFTIVESSAYWPPPSIAALEESLGPQTHLTDGMDMFDRREDERCARKETLKKIKGELRHPRGKLAQNSKVQFDENE